MLVFKWPPVCILISYHPVRRDYHLFLPLPLAPLLMLVQGNMLVYHGKVVFGGLVSRIILRPNNEDETAVPRRHC